MFHKSRSILFLLFVLASHTCALATSRFSFPDIGKFVLSSATGPQLVKQCSRSAPEGVVDFWQPSAAKINELERLLIGDLDAREKRGASIPPNGTYNRQYIGFTKNRVRFIYGNFYRSDSPFISNEKSVPQMICDGGPVFWGIVFRVDTKKFDDPSFNGSI